MVASPLRRLGLVVGGVIAAWIVLLLVLGASFGARKAQAVADRIGESLQAKASVDDHDLALVRGRLRIDRLRVERDDPIGKLSLAVGAVRCDLAPFGVALIDPACRELAIADVELELSTFALFKLRNPNRPPIEAQAVTIANARMVFSPAAVAPSLGRVTLTIEHAAAGPTTFRTPLSWIFQLQSLRATLEVPVGKIELDYASGEMTARGGLFGSQPVSLPFAIPVADLAEDPQAEMRRLVKVVTELAERLVKQKARDWVRSKLE